SVEMDAEGEDLIRKKMGYFLADEEIFRHVTEETGTGNRRHPLTFILEAADELAYKTADIEDAFVKGFISYYALQRELRELEHKYPDCPFRPLEKLNHFFERGMEKQISHPEAY